MPAPLANLLAVHEPSEAARRELQHALEVTGRFASVQDTGTGWLVAQQPLPGSIAAPPGLTAAGFWFAEGADEWGAHAGETRKSWSDLAQLVTTKPEELHRVPGDFTFMHFAPQRATLVRSVAGRIPLYRWQSRRRQVLATCFDYVAVRAVVPDDVEPDLLAALIAVHGGCYYFDQRTHLRAVQALPAASFLALGSEGEGAPQAYWRAPPPPRGLPTPAQERETLHAFRTRLLREISREADPDAPNMVSLSGGVDSSALCYLLHRGARAPVETFTLLSHLQSSREREMGYVQQVLADCAVKRALIRTWRGQQMFYRRNRNDPGIVLPFSAPAIEAIETLPADSRPRSLFHGGLADEVCGGVGTYPDWTRALSITQLWTLRHRWPDGWRAPARWLKHRLQDLAGQRPLGQEGPFEDWVPAPFHEQRRAGYESAWRRAREECPGRTSLRMDWELNTWDFPSVWNILGSLGVRPVRPFQTRALIELAFACHPAEQVGPGVKRLLKESFADLVGPKALYRQDKGYVAGLPALAEPLDAPVAGWHPTLTASVPRIAAYPSLSEASRRRLLALDCLLSSLYKLHPLSH